MNNEDDIVLQLGRRLWALVEDIPWLKPQEDIDATELGPDSKIDIAASIDTPDGNSVLVLVACKKTIRPSEVKGLVNRLRELSEDPGFRESIQINGSLAHDQPVCLLLASPWLSKRTTECIKGEKAGWFDLAGNMHINFPGAYMHAEGIPNPFRSKERTISWSSPHAQRVLRELLEPQNKDRHWRQRELRDACFPVVSLGTVNKVAKKLVDAAYAEETNKGLTLSAPKDLLLDWARNYQPIHQSTRKYYTTLHGQQLESHLRDLFSKYASDSSDSVVGMALGGISAAKGAAPYVRSSTTYCYTTPGGERDMVKQLELKEVEKGANIILWVTSQSDPFRHATHEPSGMTVTSLIQTFLDTYVSGERGIEAAEHILTHQLIPLWKE